MNVTREDVDALNANLKVQLEPADYEANVKKALESYKKNAKIPGFRPGHVPMGMIQKQYGKAVLVDELNKLINKALYDYIENNKLEILGNPIPQEKDGVEGSFDKPESFVFTYNIGLAPEIKVDLSSKNKFDYHKIKIDDTLIEKQITDLTKRYGKLKSVESVGSDDLIIGQFVELNDDDSIKEGGIMNNSTFSMDFVKDEDTKKAFKGKKVGDKLVVDVNKLSRNDKETAELLGIKADDLMNHNAKFQVTITEIKNMEPAELNEELYGKLFGPNVIKDEADLKNRIKTDLGQMFEKDADRMLTNQIYKDLIDNTKVELPDEFLKNWIKLSNEKEITDEQIEAEYGNYSKSLKWQLIQGNIFKENKLTIEYNELVDFTKSLMAENFAQYGMEPPEDDELTKSAKDYLKKKEEAERVQEMLITEKLNNFFKSTVKLNEKEISYDAFLEMAASK